MKDGKDVIRAGETIILIDAWTTHEQRRAVLWNVAEFVGPTCGASAGSGYTEDGVAFQYLAPQNYLRPLHCMQCSAPATHIHERPEDYDMRTGLRCATHAADAVERGIVLAPLPTSWLTVPSEPSHA